MNKYTEFIFEDYTFEPSTKTLTLKYSFDKIINFEETYFFDFEFADYDKQQLDTALQNLFIMAGVSYYKAYPFCKIEFSDFEVCEEDAEFFSKTYQKGLGEFFFVNKLDPNTPITFSASKTHSHTENSGSTPKNGVIVGIGGGKDSLVSLDILTKAGIPFTTWSLNHKKQLEPLISRVGSKHLWVERNWDKKLLDLNSEGALNGHVPISAILACCGTVVSILSGNRDQIVSNEQSANEPTLEYMGTDINHQYSKSQQFEQDYQLALKRHFGESQRYYSLLRPLTELRIAELFAKYSYDKYQDVFSSCNRAFTHDSSGLYWDGKCPKCAFVFLILSPFIEREKLERLFGGKNLILDEQLEKTYFKLLGIEEDKPLECVGEIKESRAAMRLCQQIYPDLKDRFKFDLDEDYDYKTLASHEIPKEIWQKISSEFEANFSRQ